MEATKHIIWSNHDLDIDDWKYAYEEFLDINNLHGLEDEYDIYEYMYDTNNSYLDDERMNLNIELPMPIIAIADLGLWNGRFSGYKEIGSNNVQDCLQRMNDYDTWYVDECGDLRCDSIHHDGVNHILYRVYKDDVSDDQIAEFKDKIYEGYVTQEDIDSVTERLGDKIARVYGWDIPALS